MLFCFKQWVVFIVRFESTAKLILLFNTAKKSDGENQADDNKKFPLASQREGTTTQTQIITPTFTGSLETYLYFSL